MLTLPAMPCTPKLIALLAASAVLGGCGGSDGQTAGADAHAASTTAHPQSLSALAAGPGLLASGRYVLENVGSGKCMASAGMVDGANIYQATCANTTSQSFDISETSAGVFKIVNTASGKSLDVAGMSNEDSANIQQWADGGTSNQRFTLTRSAGNVFVLSSTGSGKCVDVASASTADGANIQQYTCNGTAAQQFRIYPRGDAGRSALPVGRYAIRIKSSGLCLDVPGAADGAKAQQSTCGDTTSQRFELRAEAGGAYRLVNAASSKSLDVTDVSTANGALIQQWANSAADNQRFVITASGEGYAIKSVSSGKCLDLKDWSTSAGGAIQQWDCAGSANQQFTLSPTEDGSTIKALPMLKQSGKYWVDTNGNQVRLRGTNLGNWLIQEFWMMPFDSSIPDQCTLESKLTTRFGATEKERLMEVFRDNWMTDRDWDMIQSFGLNLVRVPFRYSIIEDENKPYTLRADAWKYLDYAVNAAEKRGMYVILDLHGAVGSQGWEQHSGCQGQNQYWDNTEYRNRTKWLWQQIAAHYKDRSAVAGYGLLNEPWGTSAENLANVSTELYQAIRTVDQNHIVILPGHNSGIDAYGTPASRSMSNVAFEMHFYPGLFGWGSTNYATHNDWLYCGTNGTGGVCEWSRRLNALNTPFLIGEFQPWTSMGAVGAQLGARHYDVYNNNGWAATSWSYKTVSQSGQSGDGSSDWPWGMVTNASGATVPSVDITTGTKSSIENFFRSFGSQALTRNEALRTALTTKITLPGKIQAEDFSAMSGVQTELTSDAGGGINVGYLDAKDWMSYDLNVPSAGTYKVSFRVAAPSAGGKLIVSQSAKDLVAVDIPATGGWQNWTAVTTTVPLAAGQQSLSLYVANGGFNINWWSLTQ